MMVITTAFTKSKSKFVAMYVEPLAIVLMQLIADDNFSVGKFKFKVLQLICDSSKGCKRQSRE